MNHTLSLLEAEQAVIRVAKRLDDCLGEFGENKVDGKCLCNACGEYIQALTDALVVLSKIMEGEK